MTLLAELKSDYDDRDEPYVHRPSRRCTSFRCTEAEQ